MATSGKQLRRLGATAADGLIMLAVGAIGGGVFRTLGLPLAWTLGSMTAAAIVAVSGARWVMPQAIRDVARPVVGVLAGSSFTPEAVLGIAASWDALLFVAAYAFVTTALGWWFFRRCCRLDSITAFFASTPGGLGEMTLLGGSLGGDMRSLVVIHSIRILTVVFAVPLFLQYALGHAISRGLPPAVLGAPEFWGWYILMGCGVAGYILGKMVRFPGGVMIAAMLASALVHGMGLTRLVPAAWLVALVQVVIGTIAGGRFAGVRWRELGSVFYQALIWSIALVGTAIAAALVAGAIFNKPLSVFLLALAPGGMTEMTVISYALGVETSFVIICQVGRSFLVTTCTPLFCRLLGVADPSAARLAGQP